MKVNFIQCCLFYERIFVDGHACVEEENMKGNQSSKGAVDIAYDSNDKEVFGIASLLLLHKSCILYSKVDSN